jgi:hypothetical protein
VIVDSRMRRIQGRGERVDADSGVASSTRQRDQCKHRKCDREYDPDRGRDLASSHPCIVTPIDGGVFGVNPESRFL